MLNHLQQGLRVHTQYESENGDSQQHDTAGALFRVPTSALEAGQILRVGPVTGNVLGRGGGGTEILYNGEIPLNFVTRVR